MFVLNVAIMHVLLSPLRFFSQIVLATFTISLIALLKCGLYQKRMQFRK